MHHRLPKNHHHHPIPSVPFPSVAGRMRLASPRLLRATGLRGSSCRARSKSWIAPISAVERSKQRKMGKLCVYIYIYTCIIILMCMYIYIYVYTVCIYICMYICIYTSAYIYNHTYVYIYIHTYMYMYIYIYDCICNTHTHRYAKKTCGD